VTGGTGFIGSHLARRLARLKAEVHIVDRCGQPEALARLADAREAVRVHLVDLEQRLALAALVEHVRPQVVFHLAGRVDLARTPEMTDACLYENVLATANLFWALKDRSPQALVFTSTSEVYGHNTVPFHEEQAVAPPSPYAISKVAAEHFCRLFHALHNSPTVILRLSTVYGPAQATARLIPSTILAALRGTPLRVTSGEHQRDFLFVDDAVDGLLSAAVTVRARGRTINLGQEQPVRLRDVIDTIRRLIGSAWEPSYGELVRVNEPAVMCSSSRQAEALLQWRPRVGLEEGLRATIEAYRGAEGSLAAAEVGADDGR
jgi:nucleoside-diphosphate-sugar epimerase